MARLGELFRALRSSGGRRAQPLAARTGGVDNAQALLTQPRECLATIFSPRKFVGGTDGGLLVTREDIAMPETTDPASIDRCAHLLRRMADDGEAGYAAYAQAEESLRHQEPARMSDLTQRILAGIDYDSVRTRRVENFTYLHEKLGQHNRSTLHFDREHVVPLCYPLFGAPAELRDRLQRQHIYVRRLTGPMSRTAERRSPRMDLHRVRL